MLFVECREERDVRFDSLKVGEYFVATGSYRVLRCVEIEGCYKKSRVVGKHDKDRVVFHPLPDADTQHHGSSEIVHKVVVTFDRLRRELSEVSSIGEMDHRLLEFGGGAAPEPIFDLFLTEYGRRGWALPA